VIVGVVRARLDDDHGETRGVQLLDGAQPDAAAHAVNDDVPGRGDRCQCSPAGTGSSVFEKWLNARFRSTAKIAVALMPDSKIRCSHSGRWL
jgi:hypothetical protein